MIQPKKITIEGFKAFRREQTYHFPTNPGLYLVTGQNRLDKRLGSNGSGKTAFFDALIWCLYGKTARGQKANSVSHWSNDFLTTVELTLQVNEAETTIRRTRNPNIITRNNRPTTQQAIDQLIGLNYDAFLATVLMGQFNQFFFDLTPTQKLDVFSNALNLSYWTTAAKQATIRLRETEKQLSDISTKRIILENNRVNLELFSNKVITTENQGIIENSIQLTTTDLANSTRQLRRTESQLKQTNDQLDQAQRLAIKQDDQIRQWERDRQAHQRDYDKRDYQLRETDKRIREMKDGTCPTCNQPINSRKEIARQNVFKVVAETEKYEAEKRMKRVDERIAGGTHKRDKGLTTIQQHTKQAKQLTEQRYQLLRTINDLRNKLKAQEEKLQRIKNAEMEKARIQKQLDGIRQQLAQLDKQSAKQERLQRGYQYWAKGFKELRLWLITDATKQLQVEVDNGLSQLGLDNWHVKINVEKENKNGKLQRGLTTAIQSPHADNQDIPWESWSGGETQRIRTAGAVGLQKLILARTNTRIPFEVWDEPTQYLSEHGITDLLAYLETRAKEEQKQIWLVTHQGLTAGNFAGEICIVKRRSGSVIIEVA